MKINELIQKLQDFAIMHGNVHVRVPGDDAFNGGWDSISSLEELHLIEGNLDSDIGSNDQECDWTHDDNGLAVYEDNTPVNACGLTMWR